MALNEKQKEALEDLQVINRSYLAAMAEMGIKIDKLGKHHASASQCIAKFIAGEEGIDYMKQQLLNDAFEMLESILNEKNKKN